MRHLNERACICGVLALLCAACVFALYGSRVVFAREPSGWEPNAPLYAMNAEGACVGACAY